MPKQRMSAIAAAAILISVHVAVLASRYGTPTASLWGDIIGAAAAPLLAAIAAWFAADRSGPFGRRVWRLVSLSFVLAFLGGVSYTYYYDYLKVSPGTLWPSDVLVFFWAVPAAMTLFLSPRDPESGFRWLRFCDFVQVCTLVLALQAEKSSFQSIPDPLGEIFRCRIFQSLNFVQIVVVEILI